MINTAEEFIRLRNSEVEEEYSRSANENAEINVWFDVITKYPNFKVWVIHNKTIQVELLEILAKDPDPEIRSEVARKRKISDYIFDVLFTDPDEDVRASLIWNTKLTKEKIMRIKVDDSVWLQKILKEKLNSASQ